MLKYCPGARSFVEPQIIIGICPYCGEEVEFFEYETEQECLNCGRKVRREASETCVVWCNYAEKCISDLEKKGLIDDERARELRRILRESKAKT
ncbi:MAG TPA: hypothetical protein EYP16_05785 [Candidatus Atribacteria bacterium]|nr:hypothetical protein [Candidatus Atribacteria bacterium]